MGVEQVGFQRGPGDSRADPLADRRRGGFERVDLGEQIAVPVQEGTVDNRGARDSRDADLSALGGPVERGDNPLVAAGRVGLPSLVIAAVREPVVAGSRGAPVMLSLACWYGRDSPDRRHAERDGSVLADHGDRVLDLGAFSVGELRYVTLDLVDELPDPGDLFLGGGGVGTTSARTACRVLTSTTSSLPP